jgi:serine/threonine-protein kinase
MTIRSNELEGTALANGRYLVTAKLGEGGMGSVYRATDRNIESDVVVKIPRLAMMEDPEFSGRFTREIRSLVKLSHPHIVKVTDVGTWEKTPFAVMQFLPGGSLEDQRPTGPNGRPLPCDPRTIARWLVPVAGALDYVHAQGYVHRDVKPGNILFDAEGHAFLSDFGVAKVLASATDKNVSQTAMTGTGMVLGTPEYMAPELIMGDAFDGRVDQYALAITVYELLCSRRPFENETKTKVLVLHTSKAPPHLTEWCPNLPERLSQAVLKGMNKEPSDRYANCAALAAAVAAAAEGAPVREERVRLKCPSCGKTGAAPAAEYARLCASGRRAPCPVCKTPMEEVGASKDHAARTGTTIAFREGIAEEQPALTEPTRLRGGTMAMSAPKTHGEKPTDPEPRPVAARPTPKTMVERVATPPKGHVQPAPAFTVKEAALALSSRSAAGSQPAGARKWVAVGAGAAAALVMLVGGVAWFVPRNAASPIVPEPSSKVSASAALAPDPTAIGPRTPDVAKTPHPPTTTLAKTPDAVPAAPSLPATVTADRPESKRSSSEVGLASARGPAQNDVPPPAPSASSIGPLAANTIRSAKPGPAKIDRLRIAPLPLRARPKRVDHTLGKILSQSGSYYNQVVVPAGMYHLGRSPADRADGLRKLTVTERTTESKKDNTLGMSLSTSIELDVEPSLAEHLDRLDTDQWENKLAILSVFFTADKASVLVKAEILEHYETRLAPHKFSPTGDVEYFTLVVTPDGAKPAKGLDEDWEKPGRMLHFANVYKNRVKGFRNMLKQFEQLQLNNVMAGMYADMMKGAAAEAARQQSLQRRIGGK